MWIASVHHIPEVRTGQRNKSLLNWKEQRNSLAHVKTLNPHHKQRKSIELKMNAIKWPSWEYENQDISVYEP